VPPRPLPYLGPPSYAVPPRWGIPVRAWRRERQQVRVDPLTRARALARQTSALLITVAALALIAAAAESWRYALLLQSRTATLSAATVGTSDVLVDWAGYLSAILVLLTVIFAVLWLNAARLAADVAPRPSWQFGLLFVPVVNLVPAFVFLAELEHAARGGTPAERPAPSRPLLGWGACLAVGELLMVGVRLHDLRTGVQALADGVVLHAVADLAAVALAVMTVLVVRRIMAYLDPSAARYERVLSVTDAPEPELRTARAAGSPR
jgi:hypothetical protein